MLYDNSFGTSKWLYSKCIADNLIQIDQQGEADFSSQRALLRELPRLSRYVRCEHASGAELLRSSVACRAQILELRSWSRSRTISAANNPTGRTGSSI